MLMPLAPLGFQGWSEIASKGFSSLNGPFQMFTGLLLLTALALCKTSLTIADLNLQNNINFINLYCLVHYFTSLHWHDVSSNLQCL